MRRAHAPAMTAGAAGCCAGCAALPCITAMSVSSFALMSGCDCCCAGAAAPWPNAAIICLTNLVNSSAVMLIMPVCGIPPAMDGSTPIGGMPAIGSPPAMDGSTPGGGIPPAAGPTPGGGIPPAMDGSTPGGGIPPAAGSPPGTKARLTSMARTASAIDLFAIFNPPLAGPFAGDMIPNNRRNVNVASSWRVRRQARPRRASAA